MKKKKRSKIQTQAASMNIMNTIYNCHILPVLEYCVTVWNQGATPMSNAIDKIARKISRMALLVPANPSSPRYINYHTRCTILNTLTTDDRRQLLPILTAIKLMQGRMMCELSWKMRDLLRTHSHYNTRNPTLFIPNDVPSKSPMAMLMSYANKFRSIYLVTDTPNVIKRRMKRYLFAAYTPLDVAAANDGVDVGEIFHESSSDSEVEEDP